MSPKGLSPASPVRLGGLTLENRLISAPMAGVSDRAFRRLAREAGCALSFPEMVSDKALLFGHRKTVEGVGPYPGETPFAVQILGRDPESLAQAARLVVVRFGAGGVDVNMGCPVPKVVRNGEGAALLRYPALCAAIVERVAQAVPVPVSCKIRLGWDEPRATGLVVSLAAAGAAFITVHARLRTQSYSTPADWPALAEIVSAAPVPVVGNGDIVRPEDASRMLDQTGCAAVMVGRGCLGNPWLFARTLRLARTGDPTRPPEAPEIVDTAVRHLDLAEADKGERSAVLEMRRHGSWYIKGLPGASSVRSRLMKATSAGEVRSLFENYRRSLAARPAVPDGDERSHVGEEDMG